MIEEITSFNFNTTPRIIYGPNVAKDADPFSKLMGNRILLVTDKGLTKLGLYEDLLKNLEKYDAKVTVFDDVEADPSLKTLEKAINFGKEMACTGVSDLGRFFNGCCQANGFSFGVRRRFRKCMG